MTELKRNAPFGNGTCQIAHNPRKDDSISVTCRTAGIATETIHRWQSTLRERATTLREQVRDTSGTPGSIFQERLGDTSGTAPQDSVHESSHLDNESKALTL